MKKSSLGNRKKNHKDKQVKEFDIEDDGDVFQDTDDMNSNSDTNSDSDKESTAHYISVNKSNLRKKVEKICLDKKYDGKKGSRNDLIEDKFGSYDEPNSTTGSDEEESESSYDSGESELEKSSDEHEEDSLVEKNKFSIESDDEVESRRERLSQLINEENKQAINHMSHSIRSDASKGYAIIQQNKFFDNIIDVRIKLQKAMSASNYLPLTKNSWKDHITPEIEDLLEKNNSLLEKVMLKCVSLRYKFQKDDKIIQDNIEDKISLNQKRSFLELCNDIDILDFHLNKYRGAVLNKWSTKVSSSSGNTVLSSSKYKVINQPTDIQVENQLSDMPRLLKRTKLNRRDVKQLGFDDDFKAGRLTLLTKQINTNEHNTDSEIDEDIPKNYDHRKKDNVIDISENPYIFDDEDFYRVLLNDLVDKKITNSQNQSNGITIAITSRSQNKLKKNVDTKASKGRKINYTIQEPIANYEAPVHNGFKWSDDQIDEFCAGLLGQKINFNENDEELPNIQQDQVELEAIKNDNIQIFG